MVHVETLSSPPITVQGGQLYVRSQRVQLRFPAAHGGLIWNPPVAVVVRNFDGQETVIPILDVTRTVVFTLAGLCFAGAILLMFLERKKTES